MRYFIELQYKGTHYHGWQIQPNAITVQEVLQNTLSTLLRQKTNIVGAGRTDTGVHASYYVAHFDIDKELDSDTLLMRWNRFLPNDIYIFAIQKVADDTHARFSAIKREYHYFINLRKNPFNQDFAFRLSYKLDISLMNQAAKQLIGTKDFTSFSKLHTQVNNNICKLYEAGFTLQNSRFLFKISANRFLRNMVRSIVGTLLEVGSGKIDLQEFNAIIQCKERSKAGFSVPGKALFLTDIAYPKELFVTKIDKTKII